MKLIYLDHNSSTYVLDEVKEHVINNLSFVGNPSSQHIAGQKSKVRLENARGSILEDLGEAFIEDYNVIFTSSCTESNNQVINSFKDKEIFISATEHQSVLKPALNNNAKIISVDKNGIINIDELKEKIKNRKKEGFLVSVAAANHETGVVQDIKEISKIVREEKGLFHSDCAQTFGKMKIDFELIDYITLSGYKIGSINGIAAIIYKKSSPIDAMILGGGQEFGLKAGTESVLLSECLSIAFSSAIKNIDHFINKTSEINQIIESEIIKLGGFIINKESKRLSNTSLISMRSLDSTSQVSLFDMSKICISSGSACSSSRKEDSHILKAMGIEEEFASSAIRVSTSSKNTEEEIRFFIERWKQIFAEKNT